MIILNELQKFNKENINKIPISTHGLYILFDNNKEIIYIGISTFIEGRILQHKNIKSEYFLYFNIDNYIMRIRIEKYLIKTYLPKYNILYCKNYNIKHSEQTKEKIRQKNLNRNLWSKK